MRPIASLSEVASGYDAVILDQWGVLHDGSAPYPRAAAAMTALARVTRIAVLSNSGKRSAVAARRYNRVTRSRRGVTLDGGERAWRASRS